MILQLTLFKQIYTTELDISHGKGKGLGSEQLRSHHCVSQTEAHTNRSLLFIFFGKSRLVPTTTPYS